MTGAVAVAAASIARGAVRWQVRLPARSSPFSHLSVSRPGRPGGRGERPQRTVPRGIIAASVVLYVAARALLCWWTARAAILQLGLFESINASVFAAVGSIDQGQGSSEVANGGHCDAGGKVAGIVRSREVTPFECQELAKAVVTSVLVLRGSMALGSGMCEFLERRQANRRGRLPWDEEHSLCH